MAVPLILSRTKLLKFCRYGITFGSNLKYLSSFDAAQKRHQDDVADTGLHRTNIAGIQMLPDVLKHKIFGSCAESLVDERKLLAIEDHLKKHDLLGKKTTVQECVDLPLPPLHGANIDEHFKTIADKQTLPYRKNAEQLASAVLPPQPDQWILREGWTKYDFVNKKCYAVDFPGEQAVVLDVEVLISEGNYPAITTAASATAWYSWCSKRLFKKSVSDANRSLSLDDLIPLETCSHESGAGISRREIPRLIVGHNVSFDRSFIKEQYFVQGSKTRFLDTMSLHIAISGLTSLQRVLYMAKKAGSKRKEVLEHEDEVSKFGIYPSFDWMNESCLNNLNDVYKQYCKDARPLEKHLRDVFVTGTVDDVLQNFQELMTYCADDVNATHAVFKQMWPQFKTRFPHPVTFGGMLEMSVAYLPVNKNWQLYIDRSQAKYDELQSQLSSMLTRLAKDAAEMPEERYRNDVWLWSLDWSTKKVKLPQPPTDKTADKKKKTSYVHLPRWFSELCETSSPFEPTKLTLQRRVSPRLLRLIWDGFPLHYDDTHGWGFLVPCLDHEDEDELELQRQEGCEPSSTFPFQSLLDLCSRTRHEWLHNLSVNVVHGNVLDDVLQQIENFNGQEEDAKKFWQELERLQAFSPNKTAQLKLEHSGEGPFLDVVPRCQFYKLPHKDGANKRVGNPLAKDFIHKIEQGILKSSIDSDAETILKFGNMCSYWKNNVKRICSQLVLPLTAKDLPSVVTSDADYSVDVYHGAIIPRVITAGTVTRRAVEPTWLTASNAYDDRIGSELKSMVQSPIGYHFVGADVDSQELWIAAILGDKNFQGVHGCTAFGWMTLQGNKSEGTDLHSRAAQLIGITREQAKIFNYGRIYGAGLKFAKQLLMKFNHQLQEKEAQQKAKTMFQATKGKRVRRKNTEKVMTDAEVTLWEGGSESHMFNMLETIARSDKPQTPVLGCLISKSLEPRNVHSEFMTSRVNWVVQSSAVDYLHLMLVCMRWLLDSYHINGRFCISIHDEVRYLVTSDDRYRVALALQITNLLTRSMFAYKLGFDDLPMSVAFFSCVDIDKCLRKEASMDCITPSNPLGLNKGYNLPPGESLNINDILDKTGGQLNCDDHCVTTASLMAA